MDRKELVIVLSITFIVIVIWVVADSYHTKPSVPVDPRLQGILDPVDSTLDTKVIQSIKNPPQIKIPEINNPQPTPSPTSTPESTGSAIPQ